MSISLASVLKDGTVAITSGTATVLKSLGNTLNQHKTFLDDGATLLHRIVGVFTVKEPKPSIGAPNGYTQARCIVLLKVPRTLANGNIAVDTLNITLATDVETTDAQKETMKVYAVNFLQDSELDDFWKKQALD